MALLNPSLSPFYMPSRSQFAVLEDTSVKDFNYEDAGFTGEDFNPYLLEERPVPPRRFRVHKRGLSFHLTAWPAFVIVGQLVLQALGWTFLAVLQHRGELALPFSTARWAENNPHLVTLVATLLSTLLAACSSFIFSYALRRSVSLYLLRPMSLAALGASVNISMRSVVFHRRHWKWPAVSLLFFIMTGIQTSVWSTLITPVKVVISTPLVGHDIDLSSPILQQMSDAGALDVCLIAGRDGAVYGGVPESGYANGQAYLGLPAAVSLLGHGFNVSTRGIQAATLEDTHIGSWFIPATAQVVDARPNGLSGSYSMIQQGFTADISCNLQDLTTETSPAVTWYTDFVTAWNTNNIQRPNITWVDASSNCTAASLMNITDAYVDSKGEYLWAIGCDPVPEAPNNYTLILQATGNYTDLTGPSATSYLVCQIAPKTTLIQAEYAGDINLSLESVSSPAQHAGGAAGFFAMYIITDLVWHQQAVTVNGVADQLLELSMNVDADQYFKIVEQYLQGVVEYSASILRACMSAQNLTFIGGVPLNITKPTSGTWNTQTLGWKQFSTGTTLWILIPGIFMACSTFALVVVAIYRHGGEMHSDTHTFDPSNPLHLMAVAAAGGLNNVFRGLGEKDINEGGKLPVMLGSVPGRGRALVRADEYTPVFTDTLISRPPSSRFG
ncbi:hypothetical protein C8R44DRAFT_878916 [Mycena epipterygia]|nr:hypothetical protein C8R44DRAFT_878916 [Mycena epipterygia]